MPIIAEGSTTCRNCGEKFNWICFEQTRNNLSDPIIKAEKIPRNTRERVIANRWTQNQDGIDCIEVDCPKCCHTNTIRDDK